jgi:uncharacterized protein (TIGR01777 family)
MRIIITGGSGLIGRALTESLVADNHEVIILSRHPERVANLPVSVKVEHWDGRSAAGWGHLADGADVIVNLAGENIAADRWTAERKRRIRESRVNAGRAVVEAVEAATNKPKVVIQASAVGYYGARGLEEVIEETPPGDDFLAQVSTDWEDSTAPIEELGVRRVIIRTGVVLSPEDGAFPKMVLPFKFFAGGPLGSGRQWLPWIHLADEVAAIRFLIEHETASGPFNLTAPNPLTNAEFGRVLGKVLKRPSLLPTPSLALRLAFGEMSTVLLDGQRALPQQLQQMGFVFRFPKSEAAVADLLSKPLVFRYKHRFQVQASLDEVAEFHSRSSSLTDITPPPTKMIVHQAPAHLDERDEMDFTVKLGPLPIRWVARIENARPTGFVDRQLCGPFQHWVHQHIFESIDKTTTTVIDEIEFSLHRHPWWKLIGLNMVLSLPVLFAYRSWKTRQLLEGQRKPVSQPKPGVEPEPTES